MVIVGLVVNTTRDTIMEGFESVYRRRAEEVAKRRHEHKVQRTQNRAKRLLAIERANSELATEGLDQPMRFRDLELASSLEVIGVSPPEGTDQGVARITDLPRPLSVFDCIREEGSSEESYVDFKKRIRKEEKREFFSKVRSS